MSHISPVKQRIFITFGKFGPLKYTGNLDVAKTWERVLRRAELPVLYTQGFNTRPRIQLASALPLGITSECEILDVSLQQPISLDGVAEKLLRVSPEGLEIYTLREVPLNTPTLPSLVRSAEYRICFEDGIDHDLLQTRIAEILESDSLMKTKTHKSSRQTLTDIRPLILNLKAADHGALIAHLAVGDQGNLRPEDLLKALALDTHYTTIHRFKLIIEGQN